MFAPAVTDAGNATIMNHRQKFTLRQGCHRFELQKLIERDRVTKE